MNDWQRWAAVCAATGGLMFGGPSTSAEHGMPVMSALPEDRDLPTNAHIRVRSTNGVAWALAEVHRGSPHVRFVLEAAGQRVPLGVVDAYDDMEGQPRASFAPEEGYGTTVLVMKPMKPLHASTQYTLVLEKDKAGLRGAKEKFELGAWKTTAAPDEHPPRWVEAPFVEFRSSDEDYRNVSPEADEASVVVTIAGESKVLDLQIALAPIGTAETKKMLVVFDRRPPPGASEAEGTDEHCQTVHAFDASSLVGQLVTVRLTARDVAGNAAQAPGKPLVIRWTGSLGLTICLRRGG